MRWFSLLLAIAAFAQRPFPVDIPPLPPKSAYEPPGAAAARSLAESTAASPGDLLTLAEKTNYAETARYQDSRALADRMAQRSPWLRVVTFGKTPQGRELFAVVASKDRAFTPEAARATGKPVILLQSCIHPGEVDGKEASEMLLRDVAISKRYAAWLDKVILVNIPIFNVDGHERFSAFNRINQDGPKEMGFRVTAQRLNLNRDFMKADAPEMKAWLKFFNAWLPDFFLDNHVTDGMDFQYDITIDIAQGQEVWDTVAHWTRERYLPYLNDAMATDGHIMGPYGGFVEGDPAKGFATGSYSPRYSTGYAAIQNRPALLVETHSLKSFKTRTWAHYDVMKRSIEAIVRDPAALRSAVTAADRAVEKLAGSSVAVHLDGKRSDESEPFTFKALRVTRQPSDLAGAPIAVYEKEPVDIATKLFAKTTTTASATVPEGYFVPVEWTEVIERLGLHGVRTERLERAIEGEFETFHFSNPRFAPQPFEGRILVSFQPAPVVRKVRVPAGAVYVPLRQRAARVAINLLEPDAPDSLVRWGFFHAIFEQKEYFSDYIMEPIAREMANRHPELRVEFEKRLASDAAFAKNPRQRLQWWFERSPYYEPDKDVYPVLRVLKKTW
jgi:hypothetical protein